MQIREMPRGGKLNLKGYVVNVPADVNTTVKTLPRMQCDKDTILLKFKRKLSYKHHMAFKKRRPNKVFDAAKWLVNNSMLFKNEGIQVDENWINNYQQIGANDNLSSIDGGTQENDVPDEDETEQWTEDENFENRPTGYFDTLLHPADFREFNQILSLAPGKAKPRWDYFRTFFSEFLAFPTIYCGQTRKDNSCRTVPLHFSTICKWELRNVDRRVAMNLPNIFYLLKKNCKSSR